MNTSNITNYKPKDFAELLGVSVKTLQRWDREGILKANRTPTDRRYYTYDQYLQFKGINIENDKRQVVIYARVSTRNQKDDLQNQVAFLRQFCNAKGIIIDVYKRQGQACSFNPELVSEAASIAASEAPSEGLKATFSPMIDVSRDPRWGRIMESSLRRWFPSVHRSKLPQYLYLWSVRLLWTDLSDDHILQTQRSLLHRSHHIREVERF